LVVWFLFALFFLGDAGSEIKMKKDENPAFGKRQIHKKRQRAKAKAEAND
jgi:hypothetical protein